MFMDGIRGHGSLGAGVGPSTAPPGVYCYQDQARLKPPDYSPWRY